MKRILTAFLALCMAVCMPLSALADEGGRIEKIVIDPDVTSFITGVLSDGSAPFLFSHTGSSVSLQQGGQLRYRVPLNNFSWSDPWSRRNGASLQETGWIRLSGAAVGTDFKVELTTPNVTESDVEVTLTALRQGSWPDLRVALQNNWGSATPWSMPLSVTVGAGTAPAQPADSGDTQSISAQKASDFRRGSAMTLGPDEAMEVSATMRASIDIGGGVFVHTTLHPDTTYTGVEATYLNPDDVKLMNRFQDIQLVRWANVENINTSATRVTFDLDALYYVYNSRGEYVGLSDEVLPWSQRYYLTIRQIDFTEWIVVR